MAYRQDGVVKVGKLRNAMLLFDRPRTMLLYWSGRSAVL